MATSPPPEKAPELPPFGEPREYVPNELRTLAGWAWRLLVIAVAAVVLVYALAQIRLVVVPFLVALLICTVLYPVVIWLRGKGLGRVTSALLVFFGALGVLVAVVAGLVAQTVEEFDQLRGAVSAGIDELEVTLTKAPFNLRPDQIDEVRAAVVDLIARSGDSVASGAVLAVEIVTGAAIALFITLFILLDGDRWWGSFRRAIPVRYREHTATACEISWVTAGGFIRGAAIIGVIDALLFAPVLFVLDVPLLVPLVFLIFLAAFVPIVGAIGSGAAASLVALASQGLTTAIIVAIAALVVQQIEAYVAQPLVMGRAVSLPPVAVLLAVIAGSSVAGVVGAFLSVPFVAIGVALFRHYRGTPERPEAPRTRWIRNRLPTWFGGGPVGSA